MTTTCVAGGAVKERQVQPVIVWRSASPHRLAKTAKRLERLIATCGALRSIVVEELVEKGVHVLSRKTGVIEET